MSSGRQRSVFAGCFTFLCCPFLSLGLAAMRYSHIAILIACLLASILVALVCKYKQLHVQSVSLTAPCYGYTTCCLVPEVVAKALGFHVKKMLYIFLKFSEDSRTILQCELFP